jgi:hypothetical protein
MNREGWDLPIAIHIVSLVPVIYPSVPSVFQPLTRTLLDHIAYFNPGISKLIFVICMTAGKGKVVPVLN